MGPGVASVLDLVLVRVLMLILLGLCCRLLSLSYTEGE